MRRIANAGPGSHKLNIRRAATVLAVGVVLALAAPTSANAAIPDPDPAGCPVSGQRVEIRAHLPIDGVYLVDPEGYLRHIPDPETYVKLFGNNWSGIIPVSSGVYEVCLHKTTGMVNAQLRKGTNDNRVYIFDALAGWRWIPTPEVFTKYAFSWGAIQTPFNDAGPKGDNWT